MPLKSSSKILKQSKNIANGEVITTWLLEYPRIIHCYDESTRVLVKDSLGIRFVLFKELRTLGEYLVLQVDPETGKSNFVKPLAYIEKYNTDGYLIQSNHKHISFSVTGGHRMFVGSRKSYGFDREIIKADELLVKHTTKRVYHVADSYTDGYNIISNQELSLLGFFIGDGHLPKAGKQCKFRVKKKRKIDYLSSLLEELNIVYEISNYKDGVTSFTMDRLPWMRDCYKEGVKTFPNFCDELNTEGYNSLLDGLINSDGSISKSGKLSFNTTSPLVRDKFQALCTLHGIPVTFCLSSGNVFKFTLKSYTHTQLRYDKNPCSRIEHKGKVYCVTVPSGLIVVERGGKTLVCGNCEMLTHRLFSRNTASSRAVPVKKMLQRIKNKPFVPDYWGKNQKGMSASTELDKQEIDEAERVWLATMDEVLYYSEKLSDLGVHKQISNRITEAFQYIQVVLTTTNQLNFMKLRDDENAQPEIHALASMMRDAEPNREDYQELVPGQWHLPFITKEELQEYSLKDALIVSCARCARVSYFLVDGRESDFDKDLALATRLKDSGHFSPFEHAAVALDDDVMVGNFTGWMQYRKFIEGEDNKDLDRTKRILTPNQARSIYSRYNPVV